MAFLLEQQEPVTAGVQRIACELIDEAMLQLQTQPDGIAKAIHNTRKICKRMRALLRLVRDELGTAVYRRENSDFRDISRLLSPLRDSEVIVTTLDAVGQIYAAGIPGEIINVLRPGLVARQEMIARTLLEEQDVVTTVMARLAAARQRIGSMSLPANGVDPVLSGLKRVYQRGQKGMLTAYQSDDPHDFHEWRKRVKYLWHQVELWQPAWPAVLDLMANDLHQLADFLGDAHDLVALDEVLQQETQWVTDETAVITLLSFTEQRRKALEAAARPWGLRLYVERPDAYAARMAGYWNAWQEGVLPLPDPSPLPPLLSVRQVAEGLGVTVGAVRHLIQSGQLAATKVSGVWVIAETAVSDFLPGWDGGA